MKRFIIATALTVAVGLRFSNQANAQMQFSTPNGNSTMTNNSLFTPRGVSGVPVSPLFGTLVQPNPFMFSNGFNTFSSPLQPTFFSPSVGTFQPAFGTFQPNPFVVRNLNSTFFRPNTVGRPVGGFNTVPVRRR